MCRVKERGISRILKDRTLFALSLKRRVCLIQTYCTPDKIMDTE